MYIWIGTSLVFGFAALMVAVFLLKRNRTKTSIDGMVDSWWIEGQKEYEDSRPPTMWEERKTSSTNPFCMYCTHMLSGQSQRQVPITTSLAVKELVMTCPHCGAICVHYHTPRFDEDCLAGSRYLTYWISPPDKRFNFSTSNGPVGFFNSDTILQA